MRIPGAVFRRDNGELWLLCHRDPTEVGGPAVWHCGLLERVNHRLTGFRPTRLASDDDLQNEFQFVCNIGDFVFEAEERDRRIKTTLFEYAQRSLLRNQQV